MKFLKKIYRKITSRNIWFALASDDTEMSRGCKTLAVLKFGADGHPSGSTIVRTVEGVCVTLEGYTNTHHNTQAGCWLDMASLGYVRIWRGKKGPFVLERDLTITPPADVESYIVYWGTGEVYPEYYGRNWRDCAAVGGRNELGWVRNRYNPKFSGMKIRYYLGDEVNGCDRWKVLDATARLLREEAI